MYTATDALDALQDAYSRGLRDSLVEEIERRSLYFRVSLVGACNLQCPFCHNEGGPHDGRLTVADARPALSAAAAVGFQRVQFTGGEPLIHPDVAGFVREAKRYFGDVGVTTNGTLLSRRLDDLIEAGVTRLHVSLQRQTLATRQNRPVWSLPAWLQTVVRTTNDSNVVLRLNMPVAAEDVAVAARFFADTRNLDFGVNIFSLLASDGDEQETYLSSLRALADGENEQRTAANLSSRIQLRPHLEPRGIRCDGCDARSICTEASRSLRFGVDQVLRPCLASRAWDIDWTANPNTETMLSAALLATDY